MNNKLPEGKIVLTGNQAAAYGFALADIDVFAGYPITPATEIAEEMARLASEGIISTTYRNMSSEYDSAALGIGVSVAGRRFGTATSSQGLLFMSELLNWIAMGRLPLVIAGANRAVGPPWSIHSEHTDSLLFRDFFMPQIYCVNAQEVFDMIIWAYRIAEDDRVLLPVLVCLDGFMLSHTAEQIIIPDHQAIRAFLPKRKPRFSSLPPQTSLSCVSLFSPCDAKERIRQMRAAAEAMREALKIIPILAREWMTPAYRDGDGFLYIRGPADASIATLSMGSLTGTIEEAFDGMPVKVIGVRFFRPFPALALHNALQGVSKIMIFDRNVLPDGRGALAHELRLHAAAFPQEITEFIGGLAGQNLSEHDFLEALEYARRKETHNNTVRWIGLQNTGG